MNKRTRSPNYPAISLPEALERLKGLWDSIENHAADREVVVKGMGYTTVHGASITALSALCKYGLVKREGRDYRITERGQMYLHPKNHTERKEAIQSAAIEPKLFVLLNEQFPGGTSNDELIRNYLIREKYSQSAVTSAIRSYRETQALLESECGDYDTDSDVSSKDSTPMEQPAIRMGQMAPASSGQFRVSMTDEFYVDVTASRLNRSGVERLLAWLKANQELVPDESPQEVKEDNSNMNQTEAKPK